MNTFDTVDSDSEGMEEDVVEESEDAAGTTKTLRSKANTKSKVWQYFGIEVGDNGVVKDINSPVCRIGMAFEATSP